MKQWVIAFGAMLSGLSAHAQSNAPDSVPLAAPAPALAQSPAPAPSPDAVAATPIPTTKPDNARYLADSNLLGPCQADLGAFTEKPCNVIFIGGTLMAGWRGAGQGIWAKFYEPRKALNFSVTGDTTQNVIWRLNNMDLQNLHPKVAVILIGGANLDNTNHEIADGIKAVIVNTQATFSNVKIILVSLIPNERYHDKLTQVDAIIRSYAQDGSVYYLNLVPVMPVETVRDASGNFMTNYKGIGPDGVTLNTKGYQIWADTMEPLLGKLLAAP